MCVVFRIVQERRHNTTARCACISFVFLLLSSVSVRTSASVCLCRPCVFNHSTATEAHARERRSSPPPFPYPVRCGGSARSDAKPRRRAMFYYCYLKSAARPQRPSLMHNCCVAHAYSSTMCIARESNVSPNDTTTTMTTSAPLPVPFRTCLRCLSGSTRHGNTRERTAAECAVECVSAVRVYNWISSNALALAYAE